MAETGIRSAWRRSQQRFIEAGGERFNEHDIRKTVATRSNSLEEARKVLGHQDTKTTAKFYRIGPERVGVLRTNEEG
jgi:integrase